jgi:hypothetical protein
VTLRTGVGMLVGDGSMPGIALSSTLGVGLYALGLPGRNVGVGVTPLRLDGGRLAKGTKVAVGVSRTALTTSRPKSVNRLGRLEQDVRSSPHMTTRQTIASLRLAAF